jgi:hypothetical protein
MLWKEFNWRVAVWAWLLIMAFDALMIRLDSVASFAVFILWLLINLPGFPLVPAVVLLSPNFTSLWSTRSSRSACLARRFGHCFAVMFSVTKLRSNFCSEPPPRLPFSESGLILESVALPVVTVGGGR